MSLTSIGILYPKPSVRTLEVYGSVVERLGQAFVVAVTPIHVQYLSKFISLSLLSWTRSHHPEMNGIWVLD